MTADKRTSTPSVMTEQEPDSARILLLRSFQEEAEALFIKRQMHCSEAVFCTLNRQLGGGLSLETAMELSSVMADGLGGSGCMCGALNGGVLALGLFLGRQKPGRFGGTKGRKAVFSLHKGFKTRFGSTCCRVLSGNRKTAPGEHFAGCTQRTGFAAFLAGEIILNHRPELAENASLEYEPAKRSFFPLGIKKIFAGFK